MPRGTQSQIVAGAGRVVADIRWFNRTILNKVHTTMVNRLTLATEFLEARVIQNISKPVSFHQGPRGGQVVERSKPGEFPRTETGALIEGMYSEVSPGRRGILEGRVGNTEEHALYLEVSLDRRFLTRTLEEETGTIISLLTGPIV